MTTTEQSEVSFPPGADGRGILAPLNHWAWTLQDANGAYYRRGITRYQPLLFALTYFSHYLRIQETGQVSFSQLHLDLAHAAVSWAPDRQDTSHPRRDAWVAPRGASKSVWLFLILPLWALAHGHRKFFLAFAASGAQATGHLGHIRAELDPKFGNELLLSDFPELLPALHKGARNTHQTVTVGGATLAARGMGETTLGLRSRTDRPDLIIGDDMEPGEADYTPRAKIKQLSRLTTNIIPMGTRSTVIQLTGTATMYKSIMHDTVLHALGQETAPWIPENDFQCHYYEPIVTDPDGSRRSLWPQRWPLSELEAMEGNHSYELNYLNNPRPGGQSSSLYWTNETFKYRTPFPVTRRVLSIDTAVTRKDTSDYTALAVVGSDGLRQRASVENAWAGKVTGGQIREMIWQWCSKPPYPDTLREVIIEVNQGGDLWSEILLPLPPRVRLVPYPARGNKTVRIKHLHRQYERGAVWHHHRLLALETQQVQWPHVLNDDLVDTVAAGVRWAIGDIQ